MARKLAIQAIREEIDKRQPHILQKGVVSGRNVVLNTLDISLGGSRSYLKGVQVASTIDVRALSDGDDAIVGWIEGNPIVLATVARSSSAIVFPTEIRSYNYQSDVTGWKIDTNGKAEFGDVKIRGEIRGTVLVQDQVSATGGKLLVSPATVLIENMHPTSTILVVRERVFNTGDIIWLKPEVSRQEYMLITNDGEKYEGGWAYIVTRNLESDKNEQFWSGEAVVCIGDTSGSGYLMMVADGSYGPYYDVIARNSATYNDVSSVVRLGNLSGITDAYFGALSGYGLYASGNVYVTGAINSSSGKIGGWTIDTGKLYATNISLYSGVANTARVEVGTGTDANTAGINSANAAGEITFWSGATHASRATAPFRVTASGALTATNATITGSITATTGSIGGWTIDTGRLYATNISLYSGAANVARVEVGTGIDANTAGLNSANGANEITFWSGSTHTNRASAPFRVEADGDVVAGGGIVTLNSSGLTINSNVGAAPSLSSMLIQYTAAAATAIYEAGESGTPDDEFHIWHDSGAYSNWNEIILYGDYGASNKPAFVIKNTDLYSTTSQTFRMYDAQAAFLGTTSIYITAGAAFDFELYDSSQHVLMLIENPHASYVANVAVEGYTNVRGYLGVGKTVAPTNLFEIWDSGLNKKMLYVPDDTIGAIWFQDDTVNLYAYDGNLVTDVPFICAMGGGSTGALLVEQTGVHDDVLVVDTTNASVGINIAPIASMSLALAGDVYAKESIMTIYRSDGTTKVVELDGDGTSGLAHLFGTTSWYRIYAASGDTYPMTEVSNAAIAFGAGGASDVDAYLMRVGAGKTRLYDELGIGTTPSYPLHITKTTTSTSSTRLSHSQLTVNPSASGSGQTYETMYFYGTTSGSTQAVGSVYGIHGIASASADVAVDAIYGVKGAVAASDGSCGLATGLYGQASTSGDADVGTMYGLYLFTLHDSSTSLDIQYGAYITQSVGAGDTSDELYGIRIVTSIAGDAGGAYGVYIDAVSGASGGNYAIYTNAGEVWFGDVVNTAEYYEVDGVQVVSNRVIDARIDDTINESSWDSTTAGVLDAIRDALVTHGIVAPS